MFVEYTKDLYFSQYCRWSRRWPFVHWFPKWQGSPIWTTRGITFYTSKSGCTQLTNKPSHLSPSFTTSKAIKKIFLSQNDHEHRWDLTADTWMTQSTFVTEGLLWIKACCAKEKKKINICYFYEQSLIEMERWPWYFDHICHASEKRKSGLSHRLIQPAEFLFPFKHSLCTVIWILLYMIVFFFHFRIVIEILECFKSV